MSGSPKRVRVDIDMNEVNKEIRNQLKINYKNKSFRNIYYMKKQGQRELKDQSNSPNRK